MAATLSIAMVGTRGVPARYGGFETAVEEVGSRLAARGHRVRVYTRTGNTEDVVREHLGMEVVTAGALRSRSLETLSHTGPPAAHPGGAPTAAASDFTPANAPVLPLLRAARIPVATHVDGLEWRRAKWGPAGRRYYRAAETTAVRCSDAIIADARGIQDYYAREYGVPSSLIAYGAPVLDDDRGARVAERGLDPEGYHLVVARFEPENHVQEIVEGYVRSAATKPLVVVGSAPYSAEYTDRIDRLAQGDERVRLLGAVWDQELLDDLYASAFTYVHGHSVGGTNPSLLRAIGAGAPVVAFDVDFNREVVRDPGLYFRGPHDLAGILEDAERDELGTIERGRANRKRAEDYSWDDVADGYEQLARDLSARRTPGPWRTARRRAAAADRQDAPRPAAAAGDPALGGAARGAPPPAHRPAPARRSHTSGANSSVRSHGATATTARAAPVPGPGPATVSGPGAPVTAASPRGAPRRARRPRPRATGTTPSRASARRPARGRESRPGRGTRCRRAGPGGAAPRARPR